jgi:hypothetical protein
MTLLVRHRSGGALLEVLVISSLAMRLTNNIKTSETKERNDRSCRRGKRFAAGAGEAALMNLIARLGAGENAPPEHPMIAAIRHSSDRKWAESFFVVEDPNKWVKPIEDLSE